MMADNFSFDLVALANLAKLERLIEAYTDANRGFGCFEHRASRSEAIEAIIRGWQPVQSSVEVVNWTTPETIYGVTIVGNETGNAPDDSDPSPSKGLGGVL